MGHTVTLQCITFIAMLLFPSGQQVTPITAPVSTPTSAPKVIGWLDKQLIPQISQISATGAPLISSVQVTRTENTTKVHKVSLVTGVLPVGRRRTWAWPESWIEKVIITFTVVIESLRSLVTRKSVKIVTVGLVTWRVKDSSMTGALPIMKILMKLWTSVTSFFHRAFWPRAASSSCKRILNYLEIFLNIYKARDPFLATRVFKKKEETLQLKVEKVSN